MEEGLTSIQKFLETNKSDLDGSDKLFLAKKKKRVEKYLDFSIVEYEVPTPSQGAVFVSAISALSNLTKSIFEIESTKGWSPPSSVNLLIV